MAGHSPPSCSHPEDASCQKINATGHYHAAVIITTDYQCPHFGSEGQLPIKLLYCLIFAVELEKKYLGCIGS